MALTKFKEGSARELWSVSFPLMLSSLSFLLMLFIDRVFLANYSIAALNAAAIAGTFSWAIIEPIRVLASMAEVLVAQYNGADKKNELGRPVWQMVWMSLGSIFVCLPIAIWGAPLVFNSALEMEYSFWLISLSFALFLTGALAAYYIGQGKTKVIIVISLVGNVFNVVLDYFLIFGIEGIIPPMGSKGAAIATSMGHVIQAIILFYLFLRKKNREKHGTGNFAFEKKLFLKCIRIGLPLAFGMCVEILAWGVFYKIMAALSEKHITVASIWQAVIMMFFFVGEGIYQGACSVAGNFIGAGRNDLVPKVLISGLKILLLPLTLMAFLLVVYPDFLINLFLKNPEFYVESASSAVAGSLAGLRESLKLCFVYTWFLVFFIWVRMLIGGILTAAGDTLFQSIVNPVIVWIGYIIPLYFFVFVPKADVEFTFVLSIFEASAIAALYYWRYRTGKWQSIRLVDSKLSA